MNRLCLRSVARCDDAFRDDRTGASSAHICTLVDVLCCLCELLFSSKYHFLASDCSCEWVFPTIVHNHWWAFFYTVLLPFVLSAFNERLRLYAFLASSEAPTTGSIARRLKHIKNIGGGSAAVRRNATTSSCENNNNNSNNNKVAEER